MAPDVELQYAETNIQYEETRRRWREFVEITAAQVGQAGQWRPWLPRTYWNGRPLPPRINPLSDARSDKLGRAVRIIRLPESAGVEIHAWLADFDYTASGGPGQTDELNISLTLHEETAASARILLRRWMDPGVSVDQMREIIREWIYPTLKDIGVAEQDVHTQ